MAWKLVTATTEALSFISLTTAKLYLKVDDTGDDTMITEFITSAIKQCEEYLGRILLTETWDLWLDKPGLLQGAEPWFNGMREGSFNELFGGASQFYIELSKAPIQSVSYVKYYDTADAVATFASSKYLVDTISVPARVVLNSGQTWPTSTRDVNAFNVRVVAGYGYASVPAPLKTAVLQQIFSLYENRHSGEMILNKGAKDIMDQFKVWAA